MGFFNSTVVLDLTSKNKYVSDSVCVFLIHVLTSSPLEPSEMETNSEYCKPRHIFLHLNHPDFHIHRSNLL